METTINQKVDLSTLNHEIQKIPDFILLKESRKEVGQLTAEIDYLNEENYRLKAENEKLKKDVKLLEGKELNKLNKKDLLVIKREVMYVDLKNQLMKTEKIIHDLRKLNDDLVYQLVQDKNASTNQDTRTEEG